MFSARRAPLNVTTASVQLRVLHNSVYLSARLKLRGTNSSQWYLMTSATASFPFYCQRAFPCPDTISSVALKYPANKGNKGTVQISDCGIRGKSSVVERNSHPMIPRGWFAELIYMLQGAWRMLHWEGTKQAENSWIWGSHRGNYAECSSLCCNAV
jgi:hypothetical protein